MNQQELNDYVKGKVIKNIKFDEYLGMLILTNIKFEDDCILELGGYRDCATVDNLIEPNGNKISVDEYVNT